MEDEGKLNLDDPLSKFAFCVTIPNAKHITIRELCEMRSGLFEVYDTPEIDPLKVTGEMTFDPRTLVGWAESRNRISPRGRRITIPTPTILF